MSSAQTSFVFTEQDKPFIRGKLIREIFHNDENSYTVSKIKVQEATEPLDVDEITIVGHYPPLLEDEVYTFWGRKKWHPRFGEQYAIDRLQRELPRGKDGLIQYLSSSLFPGIGKKLAANIIDTLGENAIPLILENPAVLLEVKGLNVKTRQILHERLMENQGLELIMGKLGEYGIGLALSIQIYKQYADQAMQVLQDNPYKLIEDVEGIGFKRADAIARAMGIAFDSPERMRAACLYYLRDQAEKDGHVYVPKDRLVAEVREWLSREEGMVEETVEAIRAIDEDMISSQLLELTEEGLLISAEERIYVPSLFYAEKGFARKVKELLEQPLEKTMTSQDFYTALGQLEERLKINYAPTQREAVEKALESSLMILTGGPGTGKTTVIQGICEIFAQVHELSLNPQDYVHEAEPFPILLAAPTGRAAKRMAESTGIPAVTIHRLLGWQGGQAFERSEDDPIAGRLLIVDETSMMDQWLANQLFRAIPDGMQVVLVGDEDQLPSVGPGQVLKDLLDSQRVPVVELKDIFRQASHSSVITLAHSIKNGVFPDDLFDAKEDRRFLTSTGSQIKEVVSQVCLSAVRKGYSTKDIQVLAPMYRGEAGIHALNEALQELFNPPAPDRRELVYKEQTFRVGDKVLQLVNNPEAHVFNGDIGEIVAYVPANENASQENTLVVAFEDNEVQYPQSELYQLTHAYCCSIHKAQGSEFPIVILPVVRQYYRMLRRNLIYTAVTRCRDYLILCGEQGAFQRAIEQQDTALRYSFLKEYLQESIAAANVYFGQEKNILDAKDDEI